MVRMRHWALKAAAQKTLSVLPGGYAGNRFCQRYITRSLEWKEEEFQFRLTHCRNHLENYWTAAGNPGPGFRALELGTGWYPVIPIGLYLCGASRITTVDIQPFLSAERTRMTLRFFCNLIENGDLAKILPWMDQERTRFLASRAQDGHGSSAEAMLRPLRIYPLVTDARKLELDSDSVDFFLSNGVLQDIPEQTLRGIFTEFARIATPHGVMSHNIYLGDTFATFDSSITVYNFLRFSSGRWSLINNSLHNQNRLRVSDYRRIHEDTRWRMTREDTLYGSRSDLGKVLLAKEFQGYSEQDLLAVRTWLVSRLA